MQHILRDSLVEKLFLNLLTQYGKFGESFRVLKGSKKYEGWWIEYNMMMKVFIFNK